ncbi:uncharacterized protein LOC130283530 isoform X2 [Hyla sarda]|uniref:uncharacterized protein LOC130283530 isoform X2 n=1 Tax=Hyla sarda TaxID=327740 RepID=UPI0024C4553F|nr:uncharacterized protein LOC130283530 isoform X2 [Hyla sarda]
MSSVEKSGAPVLDIIEAKSPANRYLVQLLEDRGAVSFRPPSEERVQLVFDVLDSLIPQLGVFCRVLGLIREELQGAVYSHPIQSPQVLAQSRGAAAVPYFSLVQRMQSERNEDVDAVRAELHRVNAILSMRDEELRFLKEEICNIQKSNRILQDSVTALRLEAEKNQRKCGELEEELRLRETKLVLENQSNKQTLSDLCERLQASTVMIQKMTQVTQDYRALQTVFQSPLNRKKQNMLSSVGKVPSDRAAASSTYMSTYLHATGHIYEQLLHVQNRVMNDFDHYLEKCINASETDLSPPPLDKEVSSRTHNVETRDPPRPEHTGSQEKVEERSVKWFLSQALYPDEMLLNRYAVMIYTSTDNGGIFEEMEGAAVCNSCGEKTILCPHKVARSLEICLPRSCTHIKICRPRAHMATMEAKIERSRGIPLAPPSGRAAQITDKSLEDLEMPPPVVTSLGGRCHDTNFCTFEKDLEKQLQRRKAAPRMLSQELCHSLAQRLFFSITLQLEGKSPTLPIQETVRQFFTDRYINRDIIAYGLVDFWTSLKRDSSDSKVLDLLRSVLEGDMDPAILYYVLLKAEMVTTSPLSDMSHFTQCVHKLYPFLEEMEKESLVLGFTGYSQRCVSPPTVMGFILHLVLQHQEPLIRECEDVLSTHVKTRAGHLTPGELSEAFTELCPLLSRTQIETSIQRSMTASARHTVPLRSAAQIAAFLLEREKRRGNQAASYIYQEDNRRSDNKSGRSEDFQDFQFLHNIRQRLKNQKP